MSGSDKGGGQGFLPSQSPAFKPLLSSPYHTSPLIILMASLLALMLSPLALIRFPLQSVAIDPEYYKKKKNMFVTGGMAGHLVYHEEKAWSLFGSTTKQKTVGDDALTRSDKE